MKSKKYYTENEKKIKTLKIGNKKYFVYLVSVLKVDNKKFYGFIDYGRRSIYLLKDKNINETLNHEITHAFIYEIYLKSKNQKNIFNNLKSNEFFINSLSFLIKQNFKLK
jgi:hypothetical protein